jgi:hypothetical protein
MVPDWSYNTNGLIFRTVFKPIIYGLIYRGDPLLYAGKRLPQYLRPYCGLVVRER